MRQVQHQPELASIGEVLGALIQPSPDITDDEVLARVSGWLAVEIAGGLGADFDDVWRVLTHLPDGYLRLLESPEGWVALSVIVAADFGVSLVPVNPAIH